jgi:hypothetical protein
MLGLIQESGDWREVRGAVRDAFGCRDVTDFSTPTIEGLEAEAKNFCAAGVEGSGGVVTKSFPRDSDAAAQGAADHQQARWHLAAHAVVADGRSQRGVDERDAHDLDLRHAHDRPIGGRGWPRVREPPARPI